MTRAIAKITRPGFSGVCLRKRLFARLDKGRESPCVWISGPPGAGKTILASTYIETRKLPCLWYQADNGDADPATFFYYLSQAAAKASPKRKKPLPVFTPEYAHGMTVFSKRYFEELYDRLKPGSCLVIDNYQEVPPSCAFHDALREGLSAMPEGISAVIISRGGPPASFARLLASGCVEVISAEELVLTSSESRRMAEIKLGKKPAKKEFETLLRTTGGWAAGLAVMLEGERSGGSLSVEEVKGRVFDYFAAEFFNRLDKSTKSLLMKTSILNEFDAATAGRVSGIKEAAQVLAELHRNNCFTERRLLARPVYQYHPLFREFLREQLENAFGEDGLRLLRIRAASVLEELRMSEEALELLAAAAEWDDLARILRNCAPEFMGQGRQQRLSHWLGLIPEWKLRADPWLLFWSGAASLPAAPHEARARLAAAYRLFKSRADAAGLYLSWTVIIDTYCYEWKNFRPLDGWIKELNRVRQTYPAYPSAEIQKRVVAAMFGALVFRQPHNPQLPLWEERVRDIIFKQGAGDAGKILIGNNLVFYYLWTGAYAKARVVIESLSRDFVARGPDLPGIMWCIVNALYNFHTSSYEKALSWVDKGLELSDSSGIQLLKSRLFGLGSMSSLMARRDIKEAEKYSSGMRGTMDPASSFDLTYYHQQASRIALGKKDMGSALEHIRIASKYAEDLGAPFLRGMAECVFSYYLVEAGETAEAKKRLARLKRLARETQSLLFDNIRLMNEGLLFLNASKERECLKSLSKALSLASRNGIRFLVLNLPESSSRLLAVAVKAGIERDFTADLIMANALVCPDPEIESWPWQLKVRTMGSFEVWKEEEKIHFTRKAKQKPLDLLKTIITLGGSAISERAITDMLWPEAEGDAAHSAFATTLHRLRQLAGGDRALELRNGKVTLDARYCWVDAWALEAALKRVERCLKTGCMEHALKHMDQALELYRGDFLAADPDSSWAAQARSRLRERMCKTLLKAAEWLMSSGKAGQAAEYLQSGMRIDGCAEDLCQRLLEIHIALGRHRESAALYENFRESLSARFGAEPSPATKAIVKDLLKNDSNM